MNLAGYTDVLQPQSTAVDTTAPKVIKKYEHEFILDKINPLIFFLAWKSKEGEIPPDAPLDNTG